MPTIPPPETTDDAVDRATGDDAAAVTPASADSSRPYPQAAEGVGGWLALFMFLLVVQIIVAIIGIFKIAPQLKPLALKAAQSDASARLLTPVIHLGQFELLADVGRALFALGLLIALMIGWRWMRLLVLVWLIALVAVCTVDFLMTTTTLAGLGAAGAQMAQAVQPKITSMFTQTLSFVVVWGLYFLRSKRVRNTFRKR